MERTWLAHYPQDVPHAIDADAQPSLVHLFERSAVAWADRPAYTGLGRTLTYTELERASGALAAYLEQRLGVRPGDRVALMMPNVLAHPVCLFGALRAGATVVNVNPLYRPREVAEQLADSGARVVVALETVAATIAAALPRTPVEHVLVGRLGDLLGAPRSLAVNLLASRVKRLVPRYELPGSVGLGAALAEGARLTRTAVEPAPDDLAFLQYTGGTTGVPKGAMLTHRNLVANVEQSAAWFAPALRPGRELMVTALPLYHVFALTVNCLLLLRLGAHSLLVPNPRDLTAFVALLRKHRFTAITGVNTLFNALLGSPAFRELDFSELRLAVAGGMALQRSVAERWREVSGVTLIEGYGLTEASPVVACNPPDLGGFNGAIGLPVPSTDIEIRGPDGREVAPGAIGELCVRGPQVMKGYWRQPEETAAVLGPDGFLATGDLATIGPDGFVRIVDRAKEMFVVSGFNVYPSEIDEVATLHPGVREAAAIGVPDAHSGESGKLFVVRSDTELTEERLLAHLRENLAPYKVPRSVEFRDELPKSTVGKILRRALREEELGAERPGSEVAS